MSTDTKMQSMDAAFFDEYTSHDAILKYTRATAGYGISHLLDHDYRDVYYQALDLLPAFPKGRGIRVLEFGCGAGMNLVHFTSILKGKGIPLERAVGTDFSPVLIDAAKREAQAYLTGDDQRKVEFHVAKNETLVQDLADAAGLERSRLSGSFDFILGVNTIRYCHRGGREVDCARDIMELLTPGSICVVIDMNDRFPAFRSALKNRFRTVNEEECYLRRWPSMRLRSKRPASRYCARTISAGSRIRPASCCAHSCRACRRFSARSLQRAQCGHWSSFVGQRDRSRGRLRRRDSTGFSTVRTIGAIGRRKDPQTAQVLRPFRHSFGARRFSSRGLRRQRSPGQSPMLCGRAPVGDGRAGANGGRRPLLAHERPFRPCLFGG